MITLFVLFTIGVAIFMLKIGAKIFGTGIKLLASMLPIILVAVLLLSVLLFIF